MHSNGTLPLDAPLAARCVYTLKPYSHRESVLTLALTLALTLLNQLNLMLVLMLTLTPDVNRPLGPVHTELVVIALALAMQKMGRISIVSVVSDASLTLSLRAQYEQALKFRSH